MKCPKHDEDGLSCIQCALSRAIGHLDELQEIIEYLDGEKDKSQAKLLVRDNIDDLSILQKSLRTFLNKLNPEIESWKRVTTQLTRNAQI